MNNNLKEALNNICLNLTIEIENICSNKPTGICYLLGHCLAEGLQKAGFNATETAGNLIFRDKHNKNIVYGNRKYNGKNIGDYHTWCVLENVETKIIIDPSFRYNKSAIKQYYNIKLNKYIPDFIITSEDSCLLYTYIEDKSLMPFSKHFLNALPKDVINHLVDIVAETSVALIENNSPKIKPIECSISQRFWKLVS